MKELIFETHLEVYCEVYQINQKNWSKKRFQQSVIMGVLTFLVSAVVLTIQFALIFGITASYIVYKLAYVNLTNHERLIKRSLEEDFPVFVVTFCALSGYYNNVTNIFLKSVDYIDNKYYEILIAQFVNLVNDYPGEIDSHIFELTGEIPSQNNLFFAKTVIDMNQKGYDSEIISRLVDIVNGEFDNTINVLVESIPLKFIKYASMPIMFSMLYLFMFTFGSLGIITSSIQF